MQAVQLREIDKDYRNHLQAFLNFAVKAEKRSGKKSKPIYTKFKKFYDYKKQVDQILHPNKSKTKLQRLGELMSRKEEEYGREL